MENYGEDGETIKLKDSEEEIKVSEIYEGKIVETGSYTAAKEKIAQLENRVAELEKELEEFSNIENNGALNNTLNAGESFTIPAGYTSGGTITANDLASQTSATATANDLLSGKTAWVNGSKINGTFTTGIVYTGESTAGANAWTVSGLTVGQVYHAVIFSGVNSTTAAGGWSTSGRRTWVDNGTFQSYTIQQQKELTQADANKKNYSQVVAFDFVANSSSVVVRQQLSTAGVVFWGRLIVYK